MVLSGPIFTVKTPLAVAPPDEVNGTEKVVSPCEPTARLFSGSTVKAQLLAARLTAIFVASTPVASPQEMV